MYKAPFHKVQRVRVKPEIPPVPAHHEDAFFSKTYTNIAEFCSVVYFSLSFMPEGVEIRIDSIPDEVEREINDNSPPSRVSLVHSDLVIPWADFFHGIQRQRTWELSVFGCSFSEHRIFSSMDGLYIRLERYDHCGDHCEVIRWGRIFMAIHALPGFGKRTAESLVNTLRETGQSFVEFYDFLDEPEKEAGILPSELQQIMQQQAERQSTEFYEKLQEQNLKLERLLVQIATDSKRQIGERRRVNDIEKSLKEEIEDRVRAKFEAEREAELAARREAELLSEMGYEVDPETQALVKIDPEEPKKGRKRAFLRRVGRGALEAAKNIGTEVVARTITMTMRGE